jgi:hypothetical protein
MRFHELPPGRRELGRNYVLAKRQLLVGDCSVEQLAIDMLRSVSDAMQTTGSPELLVSLQFETTPHISGEELEAWLRQLSPANGLKLTQVTSEWLYTFKKA